jgi:hypothetical protein
MRFVINNKSFEEKTSSEQEKAAYEYYGQTRGHSNQLQAITHRYPQREILPQNGQIRFQKAYPASKIPVKENST